MQINKFNWKLILQPNIVIHCDTEEKAIALLAEADSRGLKWADYLSFTSKTRWSIYKNNTCYRLTDGTLDDLDFFKKHNYTILSYEDVLLKGENEMKEYEDGKTYVIRFKDIEVSRIKANSVDNKIAELLRDGSLTIAQVNTILAPFDCGLYEEIDWTKVEVGTEVSIKSEKNSHPLYGHARPKITFKEWIEQTNQIIVFNGNKVEVYNEDEVELI